MTGMENVLAAHLPVYRWSALLKTNVWTCSTGLCEVSGSFADVIGHQAAALEAAGFGNLHDAWAHGHEAGWDDRDTDPEFTPNPYPPKVSET